jgi:hypothetical protein
MENYSNEVTAGLLLVSLMAVFVISLLCLSAMVYLRRARTSALDQRGKEPEQTSFPRVGYCPSVFDHACRWLVIKGSNMGSVQAALGLHNPMPCSWGEGLSQLTEQKLFVSPPVKGWILVIGQSLPDPADDVDVCYHFLTKLSRTLGQVQFFSVNRAVNHHAWVRMEGGRVKRAYAWSGETLWNQGEPTQPEKDLGLKCYAYGEEPPVLCSADEHGANADKVIFLAARWSFDPTAVDEAALHAGLGVAGQIIQPRPH